MNNDRLLSYDGEQPAALHALKEAVEPQADTCAPYTAANAPQHEQRFLIIEDDIPLARLLGSWLQTQGFAADLAHDGEEAQTKIEAHRYSLVLLDLNLPKIDGLTLLHKLHADCAGTAVLVLTGRNRTEDLVLTLNQGADDCLVKPFSLLELAARIRALLRRRTFAVADLPAKSQAKLFLSRDEFRVERDGRRIELTPREFDLLDYLMRQAPRPVSRATLMEEVWRVPFDPSTNIVDVYMKYLRDKIDCDGEQKLIRTVRGVGYALACA